MYWVERVALRLSHRWWIAQAREHRADAVLMELMQAPLNLYGIIWLSLRRDKLWGGV